MGDGQSLPTSCTGTFRGSIFASSKSQLSSSMVRTGSTARRCMRARALGPHSRDAIIRKFCAMASSGSSDAPTRGDAAAPAYLTECEGHQRSFPDVRHMQPAELLALLSAGKPVTLLDVRAKAERDVSMIPGALSLEALPREELARRTGEECGPLVCYCTVGYRSSLEARRIASDAQLVPALGVYSMAGILPWAHAGGELVEPATGKPTRRLHCFGAKWAAMAPDSHEAVSFAPRALGMQLVVVAVAVVRDLTRRLARSIGLA